MTKIRHFLIKATLDPGQRCYKKKDKGLLIHRKSILPSIGNQSLNFE